MKFLWIVFCFILFQLSAQQPKSYPPIPTAQQLAWHEKEFYLFIHFGPNTFTNKEWGEGNEDPNLFNPTALDCNQWVKIAQLAGAKGIILTAKHHDGFCLWPSKYSKHTVRESKWMNGKGDVVKMLSEACKKAGLDMGVYISPWDRNHPKYGTDEYNEVYLKTMKELLTQYGKFFELWWDGANGEGPNGKKQVYDFRRFEDSAFHWQPQLIIFSDIGPSIRWCGNERGIINSTNWNLLDTAGFKRGEGGPPVDTLNRGNINGKHWIPAEADVSIRPGWFYHTEQDTKVKSAETLFSLYLRSVGNGGNLLLNVPPDKRGLFHEADSAALIGFRKLREDAFKTNLLAKATLTTNQTSTYPVQNLLDEKNETFWMGNHSDKELIITIQLPKETAINSIVLEEMITYGQRIQSFSILANSAKGMQSIFEGTTIGRKKIACFPLVTTDTLQIRIKHSKEVPIIRNIMGYQINDLDKLGLWNTTETKVN
ncbi:MAG: alpha-L-fucosidase [Chitinophagia bacterium]|jgi:alpha-L-fucosidase